jgi:hypothetical protein
MRKNISNKILIVCCLTAIVSCKAKKGLVAVTPPPQTNNTVTIPTTPPDLTTLKNQLAAIKSRQINFKTFSGRADAKLDVNGDANDVTLNIRIEKDKKIWVSITKTILITIEVARAEITPDSIKVLNKLQGVYLKKPFSFIHQYASRQINYQTIEALLVGNAMSEVLTERSKLTSDMGNLTLAGNLDNLVYSMLLGTNMRVTQFNLSNVAAGQALLINNSNFTQAQNRIVPSQVNILSTIQDKKIQANLRYTKIDFDLVLAYPFNIPEGYTSAQ